MGVVLGGCNGLLVNYTGLHPFIITSGKNSIFRGLTMIISGANPPSVVVGGRTIGTISNGLNILQIATFYQLVVMGGLIIAAVSLDRLIERAR